MCKLAKTGVSTLCAMLLLVVSADLRGEDGSLLARIPPGANAIAIIDVQRLIKSPLGVREQWQEKLKNAFAAKPMMVPPNAARVVMASAIDPSTISPVWEVSLIELRTTPSMEKIAKAEGGYLDTIADKQAVWSPINAYFIRLDSRPGSSLHNA